MTARTWEQVIEQIIATKTGGTLQRWQSAKKDGAFDSLLESSGYKTAGRLRLSIPLAWSLDFQSCGKSQTAAGLRLTPAFQQRSTSLSLCNRARPYARALD